MADTAVAITAGTGTNIDTRTEATNGNHRQVVVIGDPSTNAGVAPVDATNGLSVDVKQSALPSGAATAAKQPALGTAGTASADVITVQGISSMTPLAVDTELPAAATYADAAAVNSPSVVSYLTTFDPNSGNVYKARNGFNGMNDNGAGTLRVALASQVDDTSPTAIAENSFGHNRMTPERALHVSTRPSTNSGYTGGKLISAATTNATSVKASAGTLGFIIASNINASPRYLKLYNKASAPTVGTDVPMMTILIPGNSTNGNGNNLPIPPQGITFTTGIAFAITTGVADTDTGAVAANDIVINYAYY